MLYYRSTKDSAGRRPMTMKMLRLLATAPLAAYPAGCVILLNAPADNLLAQLIGFAFILIALLGAALVLPGSSGLQEKRRTSSTSSNLTSAAGPIVPLITPLRR